MLTLTQNCNATQQSGWMRYLRELEQPPIMREQAVFRPTVVKTVVKVVEHGQKRTRFGRFRVQGPRSSVDRALVS